MLSINHSLLCNLVWVIVGQSSYSWPVCQYRLLGCRPFSLPFCFLYFSSSSFYFSSSCSSSCFLLYVTSFYLFVHKIPLFLLLYLLFVVVFFLIPLLFPLLSPLISFLFFISNVCLVCSSYLLCCHYFIFIVFLLVFVS